MSLFQGEAVKGKKALMHGKVPIDALRSLIWGPLEPVSEACGRKERGGRPGPAETQPADNNLQEPAGSLGRQGSPQKSQQQKQPTLGTEIRCWLRDGFSKKETRPQEWERHQLLNDWPLLFSLHHQRWPPPGTVLWDFPPSSLWKMKLILENENELTSGSASLLPVPLLLHQHFMEEKPMGGFLACQRHLQGMFWRYVWAS